VRSPLARDYLVSGDRFSLHCTAYPVKCRKLKPIEQWMLREHNKVALDRYDQRIAAAQKIDADGERARREAEKEAAMKDAGRLEAFGRFLQAVSIELTSDTICRSYQQGDQVVTGCRSNK
jgi:hypothetical protein